MHICIVRSRDFYHTCYCLSGLSVCQHCQDGHSVNIGDDIDGDAITLVNVVRVLSVVIGVDDIETNTSCLQHLDRESSGYSGIF